jgi:GxxExxY protein
MTACGAKSENDVGEAVIGCALRVHSLVGPGLLERAYEACLAHEFDKREISYRRQVALPLHYDGIALAEA